MTRPLPVRGQGCKPGELGPPGLAGGFLLVQYPGELKVNLWGYIGII